MEVTAIIVARGGSRRLPGKALQRFGDSTLIGHKVDQLKACHRIDQVVVGSDCPAILAEAINHGAMPVKRDLYHCDESRCTANEMLHDMAQRVQTDLIVWAHPTNPLCLPDIYDSAVDAYLNRDPQVHDSLVSVTAVRRHAWNAQGPMNFNPWGERHPLAAELEPIHFQNGAIFIQPRWQMLENRYFYGKRPLRFEMADLYSVDIDTNVDLQVARAIYHAMQEEVGL